MDVALVWWLPQFAFSSSRWCSRLGSRLLSRHKSISPLGAAMLAQKTQTVLTYGLAEFSFLWHGIFVGKCLPDGCILLFCRHCYLCWFSTDFVAMSLGSCSLSCWLVGVCMWGWQIVCHFGCLHPGLCHLWYRHELIDLREWSWAAAIWNTQFALVNFFVSILTRLSCRACAHAVVGTRGFRLWLCFPRRLLWDFLASFHTSANVFFEMQFGNEGGRIESVLTVRVFYLKLIYFLPLIPSGSLMNLANLVSISLTCVVVAFLWWSLHASPYMQVPVKKNWWQSLLVSPVTKFFSVIPQNSHITVNLG